MRVRENPRLAVQGVDAVPALNAWTPPHGAHGRGTVGCLDVYPDSRNVVPERVTLTVELRAAADASLTAMDSALRAACSMGGEEAGIAVVVEQVVWLPPQPFAAELIAAVQQGAGTLGLASMDVISGAGHEAV